MERSSGEVRRIYEALSSGDVAAATALMDPKIEWTEAVGFPYGGTYIGPDAVVEGVLSRLASEWDGFAVVPDEFVEDGTTVIALGSYSGRFKKTGRSFRARFAHVWRLHNGRAVSFEQIADTLKVDGALRS